MRAALDRMPSVSQRIGAAVTHVRDVADGVRLTLDGGAPVTAQWVVGCDGAGSLVRRERRIAYSGLTFAEPWVVVDIDTPQPLRHLPCFTYLLDPRRPAVNMPRPGGHRFEFMVLAGEDPAAMAAPEHVNRWLEPYLAPLPAAERARLTTVRVADYTFHVRTAARWRDGRVLLAGDAAHCMPPFGGQGLGAGIGDAAALAWRLDEVRRGLSPAHILDGYEQERRPRVAEMIRTARIAGGLLTATSPARAAVIRWGLRAINASPVAGRWFRSGGLRPPPRLPGPKSEHLGGRPLPNPRVRTQDGRIVRLDDVLPAGWAVLGLGHDPWASISGEFGAALAARECRALVVCPSEGLAAGAAGSVVPTVEDLDGTVLALWSGLEAGVALVRPDRFLAAVGDEEDVSPAFQRLTGWAVPSRTCTAVQAP